MWISDRFRGFSQPEQWGPALGAFILAFLPEFAAARAGTPFDPHPGWIGVLILAARGGSRGLLTGLVAAASGIATSMAVRGVGFSTVWNGLNTGANMAAFGACIAVSWIASWHLRRHADALERQRALAERAGEFESLVEGLREVIAMLRARVDRTWTSLSFLHDVATRLEGSDPMAAAQAAADLALARTGARAAAVHHVGPRGVHRLLALRDARGPGAVSQLELRDADLNVPIGSGVPIGNIALWGVTPSGHDQATAHDLEVIATWCLPALTAIAWRPSVAAESRRAL